LIKVGSDGENAKNKNKVVGSFNMYWWILVRYPEPVAFNDHPVIVLSIDRRAEYYGRNDSF
jgi:hypothetical protein